MRKFNDTDEKDIILNKLGIDIEEFNNFSTDNPYEKDNEPNPLDKLSLEELLYIREHNYFKNEKIIKKICQGC